MGMPVKEEAQDCDDWFRSAQEQLAQLGPITLEDSPAKRPRWHLDSREGILWPIGALGPFDGHSEQQLD